MRITIKVLHDAIGITPDVPGYGKVFGPKSKEALRRFLINLKAPAITDDDIKALASEMTVEPATLRGIRRVEAPRGSYDDTGMVTNLYERHVFARNTVPPGRFNKTAPAISGGAYGPGGYGSYAGQFDKLASACALDPHAALEACSWGAFQVLGENWEGMEYASPLDMVQRLVASEFAHLDSFARFVRMNSLEDELRACRAGDPASCVPFVSRYNGPGYKRFNYHTKLAKAIY